MPSCNVPFTGKCAVFIKVDIHGTQKEIQVTVDTGFTLSTGYGLKLPAMYANYTIHRGIATVGVADGRSVSAYAIPDGKILEIEGDPVTTDYQTIPTLFMQGPQVLGMMFLQKCVLHIDGPKGEATLQR
ncbi:MAG: hypothetical protein ACYC7D_14830 [Nitrososphaerales archaeon]